jgi:hypothetical protein
MEQKFYQRHVKIMPTTNKKNYPTKSLAVCYTGDEYESLNFKGTYCGYTANQCVSTFSHCLYKTTDKFIQTDNVIVFSNINEYLFAIKYGLNELALAPAIQINGGLFVSSKNEPDPYDLVYCHIETDKANRYDVKTEYSKSYKHEIFVGLYQFDEQDKKYKFIHTSHYDRPSQMYWVCI